MKLYLFILLLFPCLSKGQDIKIQNGANPPLATQPLYVIQIDKREFEIDSTQWSMIQPEWIQSIQVLKSSQSRKVFGNKVANGGVVIIIPKESEQKHFLSWDTKK